MKNEVVEKIVVTTLKQMIREQAEAAAEKKDLEYKRKLDELLKTNQDILEKLRKK